MKTIAFYQPFLNERGTCVAMFDWAYYNQKLLGNKSIIVYDSLDERNVNQSIENFKKYFEVLDFKCGQCSVDERNILIDDVVEKHNIDYFHMSKYGNNDGIISKKAKTIISAIGMAGVDQAHGDIFTYGSFWLSKVCSGGKYPGVPYIVDLPEETGDFREQLNIPKDAIVFGRHGGYDTFDTDFIAGTQVITEVLNRKENVYFLFLNTKKFINHPRVIFLDTIVNNNDKVKFINTCDAMLHLRFIGESFGLACAEFSIRNKPVITWFGSKERNHIEILGDKGIYYNTPQDLFNVLMTFTVDNTKDWNAYREYSPDKVMKIFEEVNLK
jgi:hypothetical protein